MKLTTLTNAIVCGVALGGGYQFFGWRSMVITIPLGIVSSATFGILQFELDRTRPKSQG